MQTTKKTDRLTKCLKVVMDRKFSPDLYSSTGAITRSQSHATMSCVKFQRVTPGSRLRSDVTIKIIERLRETILRS